MKVKPKMFISVEDAAKRVGMSMRHFRRAIQRDSIRFIEIRHRQFILTSDVDAWKTKRAARRKRRASTGLSMHCQAIRRNLKEWARDLGKGAAQ